ncbi:MAG: hypothetical protein U1E65_18360 [Myxococcota bacterium]
MYTLNAFFDRFNLLRAISPDAYQSMTYGTFGYVPPDLAMAYIQQRQQQHFQAWGQMLQAHSQAFAQARPLQSLPPAIRAELGPNPTTHRVGQASVFVSKSGNAVATQGHSAAEQLGALTAVRPKYAEGSAARGQIDKLIDHHLKIIKRENPELRVRPEPKPAEPKPAARTEPTPGPQYI